MIPLSSFGWHEVVGALGVVLYVLAYLLLQIGRLRGDGYWYAGLNLLAASCVLISLINAFNLSSALLNLVWITISLGGLLRIHRLHRATHFNDDEKRFLSAEMLDLLPADARSLMDRAMIVQAEPGMVLTNQGEPIRHLAYMLDGAASVLAEGRKIAAIGPQSYVGDLTYRSGDPASATVTVVQPSTCVLFEIENLRAFLARNTRVRSALEASTADHLRQKLLTANAHASSVSKAKGRVEPSGDFLRRPNAA